MQQVFFYYFITKGDLLTRTSQKTQKSSNNGIQKENDAFCTSPEMQIFPLYRD